MHVSNMYVHKCSRMGHPCLAAAIVISLMVQIKCWNINLMLVTH